MRGRRAPELQRRGSKPPRGKLLRGKRAARALRAVRNTDALERHADSDFSTDEARARVARTEIVLRLKAQRDRRAGERCARFGGRPDRRLAAEVRRRLVVAIPDPGSLEVLDKLLAALAKRPGIDDAIAAERASGQELPPAFASPPSSSQRAELSHLLAMRMPAAWNARCAAPQSNRPALIVADEFGNGPATSQIDATIDPSAFVSGNPHAHGYHVLGIVAAKFANNGSAAGRVTGVFPSRAKLTVIDVLGLTSTEPLFEVLQAVKAQARARGREHEPGAHAATIEQYAIQEGSDWAARGTQRAGSPTACFTPAPPAIPPRRQRPTAHGCPPRSAAT